MAHERQFAVVVGWLLLLAVAFVLIAPDVDLPSAVAPSRHSLRAQIVMPAISSALSVAGPESSSTLTSFLQLSSRHPYAVDQRLALECARLC